MAEQTSTRDVLSAPPVAPNGETSTTLALQDEPDLTAPTTIPAAAATNGDGAAKEKKKRKHEGESGAGDKLRKHEHRGFQPEVKMSGIDDDDVGKKKRKGKAAATVENEWNGMVREDEEDVDDGGEE